MAAGAEKAATSAKPADGDAVRRDSRSCGGGGWRPCEGTADRVNSLDGGRQDRIAILIGPEGGFDHDEAEKAAGAGFISVTLEAEDPEDQDASSAVAAIVM